MIYLAQKKKKKKNPPKSSVKRTLQLVKKERKYKHKEFASHWKVDLSSLVLEFFT